MATRKKASKTSQKAKVEFTWQTDQQIKKSKSKKINKNLKKVSVGAVFLAIVLLALSAVGSYFGMKFLVKDDFFELNGNDEITLQIGENYKDEGAKVIAFGRNDESKIKIDTNLTKNEDGTYTATEEGTFYITYTVDNLKYGTLFKIQKIRLITFVEATEQEEIDNANQGGNE